MILNVYIHIIYIYIYIYDILYIYIYIYIFLPIIYLHLGDFYRANVGIHIPAPWFAYGLCNNMGTEKYESIQF